MSALQGVDNGEKMIYNKGRKEGGMNKVMKVQVKTWRYEWTHGRKPKGGRRWAFQVGDEDLWFNGSYGEAKRAAIRAARERGLDEIEVLP